MAVRHRGFRGRPHSEAARILEVRTDFSSSTVSGCFGCSGPTKRGVKRIPSNATKSKPQPKLRLAGISDVERFGATPYSQSSQVDIRDPTKTRNRVSLSDVSSY